MNRKAQIAVLIWVLKREHTVRFRTASSQSRTAPCGRDWALSCTRRTSVGIGLEPRLPHSRLVKLVNWELI